MERCTPRALRTNGPCCPSWSGCRPPPVAPVPAALVQARPCSAALRAALRLLLLCGWLQQAAHDRQLRRQQAVVHVEQPNEVLHEVVGGFLEAKAHQLQQALARLLDEQVVAAALLVWRHLQQGCCLVAAALHDAPPPVGQLLGVRAHLPRLQLAAHHELRAQQHLERGGGGGRSGAGQRRHRGVHQQLGARGHHRPGRSRARHHL
mmetsp:Transcript_16752/g.41945  ORF Transcript_16752/g.41945 Transcript_16752/m.41945 type:complete len:206 (-) Transcript_16752:602-1219(-)